MKTACRHIRFSAAILILFILSLAVSLAVDRKVRWLGSERYLQGVNVPWMFYGADFGTVEEWGGYNGYSHASTEAMFASLKTNGANSVRWWMFCDGRAAPEFSSTSGGNVTGLDSSVLSNMDDAIQLAAKYDIYITFCLWDFGMLESDSTSSGRGEHAGGHRNIITNAVSRGSFITNALLPILHHQVAGTPYTIGTHPNVMAWDIINEPEWGVDQAASVAEPVTLAQMQRFLAEIAGAIHRHANQLVTVGSACMKWNSDSALGAAGNWWNDSALTAYDADGALDFYQFHYYGWMNGDYVYWSYSPIFNTFAAAGFDKPAVVGEFPANGGDTGYSIAALMTGIYQNGYAGAWTWGYFSVDGNGGWSDSRSACADFSTNHYSQVIVSIDRDTDGDGSPDFDEFIAGTDPTNQEDCLLMGIGNADGQIRISFRARKAGGLGYGGVNRFYALTQIDNLRTGTWQNVPGQERIDGTNGTITCQPTPASNRFYRVKTWLENN